MGFLASRQGVAERRIIDVALTNCLHSGLRRILVLTQYNALSLQNHIRDGWSIGRSTASRAGMKCGARCFIAMDGRTT